MQYTRQLNNPFKLLRKKSLREKQMSKFLAQNGKSGLFPSAHHFAQFFSRGR